MIAMRELLPETLYKRCTLDDLAFETTAELKTAEVEISGQARATEALQFGIGIDRGGFNVFALGPQGTGKYFLVEHFLKERASTRPVPPDLCYVNNFAEPDKPSLLTLPPGLGLGLKNDLKEFVEEVMMSCPSRKWSDPPLR
jgi:hypothetical protein